MYFLIAAIQLISFYLIFITVGRQHFPLKKHILLGIGTVIIGGGFSVFLGVWGAAVIGLYFLVILYFENARCLILWDLFSVIYSIIMNTFIGYLVWDLVMLFIDFIFRNTAASTEYPGYLLTALAPAAINWAIVSLIKGWVKKKALPSLSEMQNSVVAFATLFLIVIFFLLYPILDTGNQYGSISGFQSVLIRILWAAFVLVLLVFLIQYVRKVNRELKELQIKQTRDLIEYSAQIESLYDEIRGFRHDYANLMVTMEQSIQSRDMEAVRHIFEQVVRPAGEKMAGEKYSFGKLGNIHVVEVKSLLSAKIIAAWQKKLEVHFEAEGRTAQIYMDLIPFIRILAILLDNAIEAAVTSEKKKVYIAVIEDEEKQFFDIRNSVNHEVDIRRIRQRGYTTKKGERGLGLANVEKLLETQRHVILSSENDNGMFIQKLMIQKI